MANKAKRGLTYYPMDVNIFADIKIRKLIKYQGGKAVTVYAYLLCNIYNNGYYIKWDDELPFTISEATGFEEAYIQEVIKSCFRIDLFAKVLFDNESVITSKGIQIRYAEICKSAKRVSIISEFNLIDSEELVKSSEGITKNTEEKTGREVKRSKGNKSKVDEEDKTATPQFGECVFYELPVLKEKLENDVGWIEATAMNLKISQDNVLQAIPEYIIHIRSRNILQKTLNDAASHFNSWYRLRNSNSNTNGKTPQRINSRSEPQKSGGFGKL